jgi:hypothetical protein
MFTRPIAEFIKRYFLKKGYNDGWHGFIFAVLMGFYKFVAITKLWQSELKNKELDAKTDDAGII